MPRTGQERDAFRESIATRSVAADLPRGCPLPMQCPGRTAPPSVLHRKRRTDPEPMQAAGQKIIAQPPPGPDTIAPFGPSPHRCLRAGQLQLAANPEYGTEADVVLPASFARVTVIDPIALSGPLTAKVWSSKNCPPVAT